MSHEIPVSHCKYCKDAAEDCACNRGELPEWRVRDDNPWDQIKCDHAQIVLLTWIINRIVVTKEPVTVGALKIMLNELMEVN
jgi:hypothetical protein